MTSAFKHLSCDELNTLMSEGKPLSIVDIRDPGSFQAGHIPKACALSNDNIKSFVENTDKSTPVVVCCYHGNSSQQAAAFLKEQGFAETYSLDGGFEVWKLSFEVEA